MKLRCKKSKRGVWALTFAMIQKKTAGSRNLNLSWALLTKIKISC